MHCTHHLRDPCPHIYPNPKRTRTDRQTDPRESKQVQGQGTRSVMPRLLDGYFAYDGAGASGFGGVDRRGATVDSDDRTGR